MQGMVERAWETFPDYHEEMLSMVVEGDQAAVHLRITGTQLRARPLEEKIAVFQTTAGPISPSFSIPSRRRLRLSGVIERGL